MKHTAVMDTCRAMSNVKTFNMELKSHQAPCNRADEDLAPIHRRDKSSGVLKE